MSKPSNTTIDTEELKKIKELERTIQYEEAMYQSCLDHPTETAQFYQALEDNRVRIDGLHSELNQLQSNTSNKKEE